MPAGKACRAGDKYPHWPSLDTAERACDTSNGKHCWISQQWHPITRHDPYRTSSAFNDLAASEHQIGIDHHVHQLGKRDAGSPTELPPGFSRIAAKMINLSRPQQRGIDLDV